MGAKWGCDACLLIDLEEKGHFLYLGSELVFFLALFFLVFNNGYYEWPLNHFNSFYLR